MKSTISLRDDLQFRWEIIEGGGTLASEHDQKISFQAPDAWTRAIARHREAAPTSLIFEH